MSVLFTPGNLGNIEIKNRFVHSATHEGLAEPDGRITDDLIKRYEVLAKGEVGLVIPGHLYVHPSGCAIKNQAGIHKDEMIPGLNRLTKTVHRHGGKIIFQLSHAGRQTTKDSAGEIPLAPSASGRDPVNRVKPKEMDEEQIREIISAFIRAAERSVEAGADGIQLHGAHGYLINQFLSPFFNRRMDKWGGSAENRFRFLREIILGIKKVLPEGIPVTVKLNSHDHTPQEGITPPLAARYAQWLAELGIDGVEVSCGSTLYSPLNTCRGGIPLKDIVDTLSLWQKALARLMVKKLRKSFPFEEGYNLEAAKTIKPVLGTVPLMLVGGMRSISFMTSTIENNQADFIALSRPFIRDPLLVKKLLEGKIETVSCISCNKCLAALARGKPVRCYAGGLEQGGI